MRFSVFLVFGISTTEDDTSDVSMCILKHQDDCKDRCRCCSGCNYIIVDISRIEDASDHGSLTQTCGLRMRQECREHFPRHWLQRKPLVSDPGMHHGTCITHVSWWMSGSLTRGDGGNVPSIPGARAIRKFVCSIMWNNIVVFSMMYGLLISHYLMILWFSPGHGSKLRLGSNA